MKGECIMNKNIIYKGVTCAVLGATVVGALAFAPINEEPQAASVPTYKLCSHTKIEVTSTKKLNKNNKWTISDTITVTTVKGNSYSHIHKYYSTYLTNKSSDKIINEIYTKKNKKQYRSRIDSVYNKGKYLRSGHCYVKSIYDKAYPKKPSSSYRNKSGFPVCTECGLKKTSPTSYVTIKCPCCKKQVKFVPNTFKVYKA
jgi:hypothetical protein